jgi:pyoverdine/dityrosine biosynthesis protein Dit1
MTTRSELAKKLREAADGISRGVGFSGIQKTMIEAAAVLEYVLSDADVERAAEIIWNGCADKWNSWENLLEDEKKEILRVSRAAIAKAESTK